MRLRLSEFLNATLVLWRELKNKFYARLRELWHLPSEPMELLVFWMFLGLGITLLLPGEESYYSTNSVWSAAHTVLPNEIVAGVIMLTIAGLKLWGVLCKRTWIRRIASMIACCIYLFVMASFMADSIYSAWWIMATMALGSAWVFIRLGRPW